MSINGSTQIPSRRSRKNRPPFTCVRTQIKLESSHEANELPVADELKINLRASEHIFKSVSRSYDRKNPNKTALFFSFLTGAFS